MSFEDPYMYALDHCGIHDFARLEIVGDYRTPRFSKEVYEESRCQQFESHESAYRDWLTSGRAMGLPYAEGSDTYLKLVLKISDEPELLERWITYHASIVGYSNIIIMDCGSRDVDYLNMLNILSSRVTVIKYEKYYDKIHSVPANQKLYDLLKRNCKYLAVLDADEFIFGHIDGMIGARKVIPAIKRDELEFYAGIWFENAEPLELRQGTLDFDVPIRFMIDDESILRGGIAGKSVVRTSALNRALHIGHNLQTESTVALADVASFGSLGILHVRKLGAVIARRRALRHLHARGTLTNEEPIPADLEAQLAARFGPADQSLNSFVTQILDPDITEISGRFSDAIRAFDFSALLSRQRRKYGVIEMEYLKKSIE